MPSTPMPTTPAPSTTSAPKRRYAVVSLAQLQARWANQQNPAACEAAWRAKALPFKRTDLLRFSEDDYRALIEQWKATQVLKPVAAPAAAPAINVATWAEIHTKLIEVPAPGATPAAVTAALAANADYVLDFESRIRVQNCITSTKCRRNFNRHRTMYPLDLTNQANFFAGVVNIHNLVNAERTTAGDVTKRQWTVAEALAYWWPNGFDHPPRPAPVPPAANAPTVLSAKPAVA